MFLSGGGGASSVGDAAMDKWITAAARDLPEASVTFTGHRDDVPACLNAMDLFVQPSLSEGFGSSVVDAMSRGVPVIYIPGCFLIHAAHAAHAAHAEHV